MLPIKETELATLRRSPRSPDRDRQKGGARNGGRGPSMRGDLAPGRRRCRRSIIKPILVGPAAKIASVAGEFQLDIARYEVVARRTASPPRRAGSS